jgi:hypothetical protein
MSWIGNSSRPPVELAQLASGIETQGGYAPQSGASAAPSWPNAGDAILGIPGAGPQSALGIAEGGSAALGGTMNGFFGLVGNLFAQIQQYLGQAFSGVQTQGTAQQSNWGPQQQSYWGPQQASQGQAFYGSADASSVGDPHEAFSATTGAGNTVNGKWDSMSSHRDLLDSNSFNGGYRVSTQATQPNSQGVTLNQRGTVTTASGNTTVTLNANGQYSVASYGQSISLQQGQSVSLGNGESVTLNADNSLTVSDTNTQGGSITTTLATNGSGGVDVKTHANEVDLGGYLVNRSDGAAPGAGNRVPPTGYQPIPLAQQFATFPQQSNQFAPGTGAFGSWAGGDPLLAEQNVDPLIAG